MPSSDLPRHPRDIYSGWICGAVENPHRLPGIDDLEQMPYVCAMIKEVLRWRPIFPFTLDHVFTSNMEFKGYHFPTSVRFVINEILTDPAHGLWEFGGGWRICVGYKLAFRGLFINVARLVFSYDYAAARPYNPKWLNHHRTGETFGEGDSEK
ncbi:cytochrome P450 [Aspergillus pseudoustus]|uniref:Cytochrome P450 n=1 Tax=Aspergillus pseudoustus TaxID=1810923 RepID=A0ABR4J6D4_9EURO